MTHSVLLDAGPLTFNGTFIVEIIGFVLMLLFLAKVPLPFLGIPKPVFPWIIDVAEARQRLITEQLQAANDARAAAEAELKDAQAKVEDARKTAQSVIDGAMKSGEQLRQELKQKAEEEAARVGVSARKDIEVEREKAIQSVRAQVADLVVEATEKVIGETLDGQKHKQLIERAIAEVASGDGSR